MGARPSSFKKPDVVVAPKRVWSEEQQAIFDWFQHAGDQLPDDPLSAIGGQNLVVTARAGCLAGDTYISINRAGKGWTLPLAELVAKANGIPWPKSKGWDLSIPTFVQREQDGVIRLGRLKTAWASGIKQTYTVQTDAGRTIRATDEHPFKTRDGWSRLDQLRTGMSVLMRGSQSKPCVQSTTTYSDESGMWNHPYAIVRTPDKTHPNGSARVPTHRLVVEADRNLVEYQEFLWRLRSGQTDGLVFLDPSEWAVHHKDRDTRNNTIANLDVLTPVDHRRVHGLTDTMSNVLFGTTYEQIVAIDSFDREETFDLEVDDAPHNFIANGFVVHNTGKTTTIIEGVSRAPEPSVLICAFNKRIAEDIGGKVENPAVEVKTLHAVGMHAIQREWRRIPVAERGRRADSLTDLVVPKDTPRPIRRLISLLHTKGREMQPLDATMRSLRDLELFFDYCPEDGWGQWNETFVATQALAVMEYAKVNNPTYDIGIDFADMIFLPLTWNLLTQDYQMVVVDEAQDMTVSQLEVAKRVCSGRIVVVGDDRQAIYGFRGADSHSLSRLKEELHADHLTLKTTYRCGARIVAEAQTLVPDIVAHAANAPGRVDACGYEDLLGAARGGDFVLSRLNAPLVSLTLRFLQRGVRARMAGRDIGAGITAIIRKLKVNDYTPVETLLSRLDAWERKISTRLAAYGQVALVERARDQAAMIWALAEDADTCKQVLTQIEHLFTDDVPDTDVIRCSSVHKAKGLEADRVFVLQESLYRRGRNPEEENIEYVAITRAKRHLTRVTGVPSLRSRA